MQNWLVLQSENGSNPPSPPRTTRRRWVFEVLGVSAVAVLIAGAVILYGSGDRASSTVSQPKQSNLHVHFPTVDNEKPRIIRETADPLGWNRMLGGPPKGLTWPGQQDPGSWGWDNERKTFLISSGTLYFVRLGEIGEERVDLSIDVNRPSWNGITGLFFGYRVQDIRGEEVAQAHMIRLFPGQDHQQRPVLKVQRRVATVDPQTGSLHGWDVEALVSKPPPRQRGSLGVRLEAGKITRISWCDQELPELTNPRHDHRFEIQPMTGDWGVFTHGGASLFSHLTFQGDRP